MGRHREFAEEDVLQLALNVFWQKGFECTSLEDLTKATGVARPGLYAAFGNKEGLFLRAVDLYESKYMSFMSEALREPTSRRVVELILRGSVKVQTMSTHHRGCLGINGALACSDDAEHIRLELIRRREANQLALCKRFEKAVQEGDLPPTADASALASFVMALTQGMAVQAKAGASRKSLESLAEHALATWPVATS